MSDSSDGDMPEWLKQHTQTPSKIFVVSSSDSDDDIILRRKPAAALPAAAGPSQPPPKAGAKQESGVEVKQEAGARGAAVKAEPRVAAGADPRTAPLAGGAGVKPALNDEPGGAGPLGEPLTQTQPQTQTQAQTQTQPPAGSLPLMLPDKINRNKVLFELPPPPASSSNADGYGHGHGATDLSGDAGAVGRLIVLAAAPTGGKGAAAGGGEPGPSSQGGGGPGGAEVCLQVDLKGVIYNAWALPLAGTAMVLNVGPTEAKVESLFNDFVRLREAADVHRGAGVGDDGDGLAHLLGDDDDQDNYQPGVLS
eukprot:XP_001699760.1 predicted protein [Chlamydomonas reinhardtii]